MWLCGSQWNRKNCEGKFLFSRDFYETYKELITYFHEIWNLQILKCLFVISFLGKNWLFQQKWIVMMSLLSILILKRKYILRKSKQKANFRRFKIRENMWWASFSITMKIKYLVKIKMLHQKNFQLNMWLLCKTARVKLHFCTCVFTKYVVFDQPSHHIRLGGNLSKN